jgi:peroxiredoxin
LFLAAFLSSAWQTAEAIMGHEVGYEAPDFSLPNTENQIVRLSDRRGQEIVVLIFYRGQW